MSKDANCPFHSAAAGGTTSQDWWPNQLRVDLLNQHSRRSDPLGPGSITLKSSRSWTSRRSRQTSSSS